jgi:endonuclease/exonuclease/phosphatase family metal-dependent hydrolase
VSRLAGICAGLLAASLAPAASAGPDAAPAARAVEFSVLSYNTHGLPAWVARDAPEQRFPKIGALVRAYDVALLQEDFAHHPLLREGAGDLLMERGNPSRFLGSALCALLCDGSGLTFLSRLPRGWTLGVESRPYDACSGWLGGANDCLATKGFQHARVLLGGALEVHFVNTHLDAGRAPEDREARRAQLEGLRGYLEQAAAGAPLVLGGDLNLDAADPADAALRDAFAASLGLEDTGASAPPGGRWTRLDYLYRRDGAEVRLELLGAGEAGEFADSGAPLSDHPAIFARLRAVRAAPPAGYRVPEIPPSTGITVPVR